MGGYALALWDMASSKNKKRPNGPDHVYCVRHKPIALKEWKSAHLSEMESVHGALCDFGTDLSSEW